LQTCLASAKLPTFGRYSYVTKPDLTNQPNNLAGISPLPYNVVILYQKQIVQMYIM